MWQVFPQHVLVPLAYVIVFSHLEPKLLFPLFNFALLVEILQNVEVGHEVALCIGATNVFTRELVMFRFCMSYWANISKLQKMAAVRKM